MWRCFVRDQARVPSVAGAVAPFFVTGTVFFHVLQMRGARTLGASAAVGASQNVQRVDATTRVTETEARAGGAVAGSSRSSPLLRLGGAEELLLEPDRLLFTAAGVKRRCSQ